MSSDQSNEITALYPPPPPYMKFFTEANLEKLPEYQKIKNGDVAHDHSVTDEIACELDFLIPPRIPETGQYRAFGSIWQIKDELPDLKSLGMTQLYSKPSTTKNYQYKIQELRKLLKSLLLNFLELIGVLSVNPESFPEKLEHIRTILVNIHHLLNEYRPHQSRESLIMLLEEQLEYKKKEIQHIEQICEEVRERLKSMCDVYIDGKATSDEKSEEKVDITQEHKSTEEEDAMDVDKPVLHDSDVEK